MSDADIARLRWRCRRGLLELDVLLQGFLEERYAALTPAERAAFDRLLDLPDQRLLAVLYGQAILEDGEAARLVAKIRT